jgi:hypothetical protein
MLSTYRFSFDQVRGITQNKSLAVIMQNISRTLLFIASAMSFGWEKKVFSIAR